MTSGGAVWASSSSVFIVAINTCNTLRKCVLKEEYALNMTKWSNDIQYHSGDQR